MISFFTAIGLVVRYVVLPPMQLVNKVEEHDKMLKMINSNLTIIAQKQKDIDGKILDLWREQAKRRK